MVASPYLPDIVEGIVGRVANTFNARSENSFDTFFEKGIYEQVSKQVYQRKLDAQKTNQPGPFPVIWFQFPFVQTTGQLGIAFNASIDLIIATTTDPAYNQTQRDDEIYRPYLLPLYDELMAQFFAEKQFQWKGPQQMESTVVMRPYWGGSDVGGPNSKNLWKDFIDAIWIRGLKVAVKQPMCSGVGNFTMRTA